MLILYLGAPEGLSDYIDRMYSGMKIVSQTLYWCVSTKLEYGFQT